MRLGGPIFQKVDTPEESVALHRKYGFGAASCPYVEDPVKREKYKKAFAEADIVLAEFGAYCINILDTNETLRQKLAMPCGKLVFINLFGSLMFYLLN